MMFKKFCSVSVTRLGLLCYVFWSQTGFVLLSNQKATLPVSVDAPTITFQWDGSYPEIDNKDEVEGGAYASLDDEAFMLQLLTLAVDRWNDVRGSYLRLAVQKAQSTVAMDPEDKIFTIVVESSDNQSSAAYAAPQLDDEGTTIIDCDINVADKKTGAPELLRTLTHELGHCIGLGHAHSNYGALMGYSRTDTRPTLGADDKAGIIFLYPDPKYVDGGPKEMVGCGNISAPPSHSKPMQNLYLIWLVLFGLLLPLGIVGLQAKLRGNSKI